MLGSEKLRHAAVSAVVMLAAASLTLGDTIHLKDGSIIKGHIERFENGTFTITMGEGSRRREMTFGESEIASIAFDDARSTDAATRTVSYTPATEVPAVVTKEPVPTTTQPAASPGEKMKPISWQVKVLADNSSNGWTNSGWVLKKGQRIRITGDGTISLGKGHKTAAAGLSDLDDTQKLLKNVPTGALIAVIGDDNNDFIYVGSERTFTASRDGALFLGVNEGNLDDNSGAFNVTVEILPDGK